MKKKYFNETYKENYFILKHESSLNCTSMTFDEKYDFLQFDIVLMFPFLERSN